MSATTAQQIVLNAVEGVGFPAPFKELILLALSQPGRILDNTHPSLFHDIITASCTSSRGRIELAPRVASAFEFCIAASDILDEIEDGDDSVVCSRGGMPRALNASTALLSLTFSTLSALDIDTPDKPLFLDMVQVLSTTIAASTVGQDADLSTSGTAEVSTSRALAIARAKSGTLIAGASQMGATLGTSDPVVLSLYRDFGRHLGTAYQLNNDMRDARSAMKSDVSGSKSTIPLVFQNTATNEASATTDESALRASGALHFTWVLMETELNACRRIVESLRSFDQVVDPLEHLVNVR